MVSVNDTRETTSREPRSHSQLSDYNQCPRMFQLSRVEKIKRRPGAWFPAGTAVHKTIERYLRAQLAEENSNA
jgi:hypothetical protein